MNEPITVPYDLTDILKELKQDIKDVNTKLDKQSEKLNTIGVELAEIKIEVKALNKDVTELKGSTKAQIWTLIGILVTAVSGFFSRCSQIRLLSHSLTFFLERVASRSLFKNLLGKQKGSETIKTQEYSDGSYL